MAKLKEDPITSEDIKEYLEKSSDFAFEVRVLQELVGLDFECQHGGTYTDPITEKSREFDVRALYVRQSSPDEIFRLHLSVEAKNLKDYFPLVVHTVKRQDADGFHNLIRTFKDRSSSTVQKVENAVYSFGSIVGKATDQVGRYAHKPDELYTSDADVFEKISQAINSAYDLIREAHEQRGKHITTQTFVCPILVVPEGTLWTILYDDNGSRIRDPRPADYVSYYVNKTWRVGKVAVDEIKYGITHLEIVTFSHLKNLTVHLKQQAFKS